MLWFLHPSRRYSRGNISFQLRFHILHRRNSATSQWKSRSVLLNCHEYQQRTRTRFFSVETGVQVSQSEVSGKIKHFWNGAGVTQQTHPSVWSTEIQETKRNDHTGEIQVRQVTVCSWCERQNCHCPDQISWSIVSGHVGGEISTSLF